jgi:hypothetical protein
VNERSSLRGGELRGDEEEGSSKKGCSEEKEVASLTIDYAGGGTPQRHSYSILSYCSSSIERFFKFINQIKLICYKIDIMFRERFT